MAHHTHGQPGTGNAQRGQELTVLDDAVLDDSASATGGVLLSRHARVGDAATLSGAVEVTDNAIVDGSARISGSVRIDSKAHVGGAVAITGENIRIGDEAQVLEQVEINGTNIEVINRTVLRGDLRIGSQAQILHSEHAYRWNGHHDGMWTVYRNHRGDANAVADGSWDLVTEVEHADAAPHELKRYIKDNPWR
jgi:cytoskeletal protein CcmA (bactofilin family)